MGVAHLPKDGPQLPYRIFARALFPHDACENLDENGDPAHTLEVRIVPTSFFEMLREMAEDKPGLRDTLERLFPFAFRDR